MQLIFQCQHKFSLDQMNHPVVHALMLWTFAIKVLQMPPWYHGGLKRQKFLLGHLTKLRVLSYSISTCLHPTTNWWHFFLPTSTNNLVAILLRVQGLNFGARHRKTAHNDGACSATSMIMSGWARIFLEQITFSRDWREKMFYYIRHR